MQDWVSLLASRFRGRMARDEYIVRECPFCGNDRWNFEVNVEKLVFSCWVCNVGGTVRSLFYEFGLPVQDLPKNSYGRALTLEKEDEILTLPEGSEPIIHSETPLANWAFQYLINRGLTIDDIVEYQIKFTIKGRYGGRVIWPIYEDDDLVYFVARRFMEGVGRPYDYPDFRRRNICSVYLGHGDRRTTLVLVEGVLQVPSIRRLGYSVMPLLGKKLTLEQMRKLYWRRFRRAVVLLDEDSVLESIDMARDMKREGLRAFWSRTGGPDSDELRSSELEEVIETAQEPSVRSIVLVRAQRRRRLERILAG